MSDIELFDFKGSEIRIVMIDGNPWFVAKDVCDVLEHTNSRAALERLKSYEKGTSTIRTLGGNQEITVISESGLYRLVLTSRKPQAELFRDWLAQEVLPSLQKWDAFRDSFNEKCKQASTVKTDKAGFVYLIKQTKTNLCKIGVSRDVYARLQTLQTGSPFELVILKRIFSINPFLLESQLHEYYQAYCVRGEWFDFDSQLIAEFDIVALRMDTDNDMSLTLTGEV